MDPKVARLFKNMNVLIFDPDHRGHHLQYVGILANALANAGMKVTAAVGEKALSSTEGQTHLEEIDRNVELDTSLKFPPLESVLGNAKFRLSQLESLVKNHAADHLYLPYGDGLVQLMGMGFKRKIFRDTPTEALIFHGGRLGSFKGAMKDRFHNQLIRRAPCVRLHFLSPIAYDSLGKLKKSSKFRVMPEPVEDFPTNDLITARKSLGLGNQGKILSCLGMITSQKNVEALIDAFLAATTPIENKLLLVGRQDESVSMKLNSLSESKRKRIIELNEYVSNTTFLNAIMASDVVAIPYKNRAASSGILVRAINAGKQIITDREGFLGWLTERFQLGESCDVGNQVSFADAITKSFEDEYRLAKNPAREKLIEFHTLDNFGRSWVDFAQQKHPQKNVSSPPILWETVLDS